MKRKVYEKIQRNKKRRQEEETRRAEAMIRNREIEAKAFSILKHIINSTTENDKPKG